MDEKKKEQNEGNYKKEQRTGKVGMGERMNEHQPGLLGVKRRSRDDTLRKHEFN